MAKKSSSKNLKNKYNLNDVNIFLCNINSLPLSPFEKIVLPSSIYVFHRKEYFVNARARARFVSPVH